MCRRAALGALLLASIAVAAAEDLRNWYDDPFVRLASAIAGCPEPAGPRVGEAEHRAQSHHRAERGTTCWLKGEPDCERPNAYAYDRDIAADIVAHATGVPALAESSLWLTVQGRVVYVEGCVRDASSERALEDWLRARPHVVRAVAIVTAEPSRGTPYRRYRD